MQLIALLTGLIVIAAGIAVASFVVKPSKARSFDLFYGSLLIDDNTSPVVVDLASGKPTVRLSNAFTAVSAKTTADLDVVPLGGGNTLMLNPTSGEFNMVDSTGFVVKTTGGGVRLPKADDSTRSSAVPAGSSAYLLQSGASGSSIYLVSQLTVASAVGANAKAKARAYATLTTPVADLDNPAGSANGDLWLLTGSGDTHAISQLSVPAGSNAGVTLTAQRHGTVTGAAAVGSATRNADGTGGDVAAVASANSVQVFSGATASRLAVKLAGTVDIIRAASNAQGRLVFLYHSTSSGWNQVAAPTSGVGPARVTKLDAIDPGAQLVTPAESDGHLYTMDTLGSGDLWQIDSTGAAQQIPGTTHYPTLSSEHGDLSQSEVVARGSRVIFNARANYEAEVVFSDGSHAPRVINKHSAVSLDPSGATALTDALARSQGKPGKPAPGKPTTKAPQPAQAINDKVDCKTTTQNPHVPNVSLLERGSRSISLEWAYPLLAPSDCAPSTYTVATKAISSDAPSAPGVVTVQGQNSVTLTGLFPDTEYQLIVTAYLNKIGTRSTPLTVRTDVEGPAAPTNVHTSVDSSGNWTVAWDSCGGVQSGCVPVADWQIIPRLCDGQGLSGAPATAHLTGDPTLHSWQWTYQGNDGLLGRGLSFTIEGVGTKGTVGAPAADKSCSYSWTTPVEAAISVSASAPAQTAASQATTDTTVAVEFADGQVHDLGGVGGQLSYELLSGGSVVSRSGPTTKPAATLTGITAGRTYQVVVRVNPPRHPEAAVTLAAVDVQAAVAAWPQPSVAASFANSSAVDGTLTVAVGLSRADNRGETFDLLNGQNSRSTLDCTNVQMSLQASGITPGNSISFPGIDRFTYSGTCTVTIQLVQNSATATDPPLYGAGASARVTSAAFTIEPPSLTTTGSDFTATWNSGSGPADPQIVVSYHGHDQLGFAGNWSMVADNGSANCGSTDSPPTATIHVDKSCVSGATKWTVTISYQYFLSRPSFTVDVEGSAPEPVDPTKMTFTGTWNTDPIDPQVIVQYNGPYDANTLSTLNWTETVTSNGVVCGTSTAVPSTDGTGPNVPVDITKCPPTTDPGGGAPPPTASTYTLTVHYDDPNYGGSKDYTFDLPGSPPQ